MIALQDLYLYLYVVNLSGKKMGLDLLTKIINLIINNTNLIRIF